ncbi:MAG: polyphosphate kinase 2 family protein [Acidobacteria bacterium]|nr:MAG: polyphosphate kinase 2 family protein [Acidobacteriota bacterium]
MPEDQCHEPGGAAPALAAAVLDSPYLVPFDGSFTLADHATAPDDSETAGRKRLKKELEEMVRRIADLQRVLYADDRYAVLLVFQAMDAAGKDGTIRKVLSGVNPAGCHVKSFKQPNAKELDHDFLWRTTGLLPERGEIGVFNRSYYEEVLIVRVHPELLVHQKLPHLPEGDELAQFWDQRLESIRCHERHLARCGTVVLKFWLNVSLEEQRRRFLSRLDEPEKHWKFSVRDVEERQHWPAYMHAYEQALRHTSRPWAPWFAIPADDKRFMRREVARIVLATLESLDVSYPVVAPETRMRHEEMRQLLEDDFDDGGSGA